MRTIRTTLFSNLASHSLGLLDRGFEIPSWRSDARRIVIFAVESAHSPISLATLNVAPPSLAPLIFPRWFGVNSFRTPRLPSIVPRIVRGAIVGG
jgi:hypothetical protein